MKKLYFLFLLMLPLMASAQDALYDTPNRKVELNGKGLVLADSSAIYEMPGVASGELMHRAKLAVIHAIGFVNVLQIDNAADAALFVRASYPTDIRPAAYHPMHPFVSYVIEFRVKDGRYRLNVGGFGYHMDYGGTGELFANGSPQWFQLRRWRNLISEGAAYRASIMRKIVDQMNNPQPLADNF